MASLILLANEILDEILAHLPVSGLLAVALTCNRLNKLSTSFIYRSITLSWTSQDTATATQSLINLLRTVISKPELASQVLRLDLRATSLCRWGSKPPFSKSCPKPSAAVRNLLNESVQRLELPQPHDWAAAFLEGRIPAMAVLLVFQLAQLRGLKMGMDIVARSNFLAMALRHASGISFPQQLQQVSLGTGISDDDDMHYRTFIDIRQFWPILSLPNLKCADLQMPSDWERNSTSHPGEVESCYPRREWLPPEPSQLEKLTVLRLRCARATPEMVMKLLTNTPSLTVFEYDYWCRTRDRGIDCDELATTIAQVSSSLKTLKVAITPYTDEACEHMDLGDSWIAGSFGLALARFPKLESLDIAPVVLLGWYVDSALSLAEVLPSKLRSLRLRDGLLSYVDWEWTENETMGLVRRFVAGRNWTASVPFLERIDLRLDEAQDWDWLKPVRDEFQHIVEDQGLRCDILKRHPDRALP